MSGESVWVWVLVAVVVALIGVALLISGRRYQRRRTAALRRRFGPEYDRAVRDRGRRRGESELLARIKRRRELPIRSLDPEERRRFETAWESAQSTWVETPVAGLRDADLLVLQVMRERGYPVEHVEDRIGVLSVDHADQVEQYRAGHALASGEDGVTDDNEAVRRAIVGHRYLFCELLEGGEPERTRRL
jgi:hypothetical protein